MQLRPSQTHHYLETHILVHHVDDFCLFVLSNFDRSPLGPGGYCMTVRESHITSSTCYLRLVRVPACTTGIGYHRINNMISLLNRSELTSTGLSVLILKYLDLCRIRLFVTAV